MKRKKIVKFAAWGIVAALVAWGVSAIAVYWVSAGRVFDKPSDVPHCRAAVVLGCRKALPNGLLNLYFARRIAAAAELYKAGKVDCLIVSGDNHIKEYDEASDMKESLAEAGVPADRVVCDYAGFRTLDSVVRAKKVFGLDSFIVVSQKDHVRRAVFTAHGFGCNAYGYAAPDVNGRYSIKTTIREQLAKIAAVLDVILRRGPKFLGPRELLPEGSPIVDCCAEEKFASEAELPKLDALVFKSEGSTIYGQVLVPSAKFAGPRPCVIFCHGFAGFTRWDDVAHDLCRAGIAVVLPHHRGAWGSEGEYTVSGCIKDAENLAQWAMGAETAAKYGLDTNAVYLVGHSMGGNSVVNATARLPGVRGVALVAPCEIGYMAQSMSREELKRFLIGEGMLVLHRASDDSIVDDIIAHAAEMRFERAANALEGKKVFLATAEYDRTVPTEPLDAFWNKLGTGVQKHRKTYRAGHSLMGARLSLAADLKDFILGMSNE